MQLRGRFLPGMLAAAIISVVSLTLPAASMAAAAPANATVAISDTGDNPATVTIAACGTVTWTSTGWMSTPLPLL